MYLAGDFRNGVTFEMEGSVYQIIEFQHVKPGKGAAFVRTKVRNVLTGAVVEKTFSPTDKFPQAFIERKEMQYLYEEDKTYYYFMDTETYDQISLTTDMLPDSFKFVKENTVCKILSYKGKVFSVEPPTFMELRITETEPAVRGNTSNNALKTAVLETGAEIKVPLFIEEGEVISVDLRTGEYMGRA